MSIPLLQYFVFHDFKNSFAGFYPKLLLVQVQLASRCEHCIDTRLWECGKPASARLVMLSYQFPRSRTTWFILELGNSILFKNPKGTYRNYGNECQC
jgi:hypothetical protein